MSTTITTGRIRFNLRERGFRAHGQPRDYNIPMLVASINSLATQERVENRAMQGYLGHWPRIKFGHLTSVEGGLEGGRPAVVEPAVVTTYLRAEPDGTVEHEIEFLTEFESGRVAARMNKSRIGGLSSVIDSNTWKYVGADYVGEQNFKHNRGYSLDSAGICLDDAMGLGLDDIEMRIRDEHLATMAAILDSSAAHSEGMLDLLQKSNAALREQEYMVEELLSQLAARNPGAAASFDTAAGTTAIMLDAAAADLMLRSAASFRDMQLEALDLPGQRVQADPPQLPTQDATARFTSRLLMG